MMKAIPTTSILNKLLTRDTSCNVSVMSVSRRPRAIVIVMSERSWSSITTSSNCNYTLLYQSLECSTICVSMPLLIQQHYQQQDEQQQLFSEWAVSIAREAARLVRMAQFTEMGAHPVPILIHAVGRDSVLLLNELFKILPCRQVSSDLSSLKESISTSPWTKGSSSINTSTRSLFTNATEPLSDDDDEGDDDDEASSSTMDISNSSSDACSSRTISPTMVKGRPSSLSTLSSPSTSTDNGGSSIGARVGSSSRLSSSSPPMLPRRPTLTTCSESSLSPFPIRESSSSSCTIHRVDLQRTGVSFHHSYNIDDRAYRRDLELCVSHLDTIVWDLNATQTQFGWRVMMLYMLWSCLYLWHGLVQTWLGIMAPSKKKHIGATTTTTDELYQGLSLTRNHAFCYKSNMSTTTEQYMTKAMSMDLNVQRCMLPAGLGRRRQAHNDHVAFLTRLVNDVATDQEEEEEEEGWSSLDDDELPT